MIYYSLFLIGNIYEYEGVRFKNKNKSNFLKGLRNESFVWYFIGYSEDGAFGYKIFVPDLREILVGVHVLFNEMILSYSKEYFQEFENILFKTAVKEENSVREKSISTATTSWSI